MAYEAPRGWTTTIAYRLACAECEATGVLNSDVPSGHAPPLPELPEGWHLFDDLAICPACSAWLSPPSGPTNLGRWRALAGGR